MSEEHKQDRSPNYPKLTLEQGIELVKRMYKQVGKAKVKAEVAIVPLGYTGINGASLGTLGSLNAYGLIDRERGEGVAVSQLAIKIIHPLNKDQQSQSIRESALRPRVFTELKSGGFHHCSESVIANHLIQNGFTAEGAKKAASVFVANISFASLHSEGDNESIEKANEGNQSLDDLRPTIEKPPQGAKSDFTINPPTSGPYTSTSTTGKILARYSIPLGANEATLLFTGESLSSEDFDALIEYVELFKKQYERKSAGMGATSLQNVTGKIATQPKDTEGRVTFLLALPDGQVLSCLSGAGTKFTTSQFINGEAITLSGERKRDFILGESPCFVFSDFKK